MKKVFSIILSLIVMSTIFSGILFLSEDVSAATNVSGKITIDITWTGLKSPYIVVGDVIVDNGTTLTIEPGVSVKFDGKYSLIVNGTLNATGTKSKSIIFTSNQSAPLKGDWNRIRLHGKNNTMQYCEISFGHYPLYIMGENTNNSISYCNLHDNDGDGIYLKKTSNNTIDNVTVSTSYSNGITLLVSENNTINNSYIVNNRAFGIYLRSSSNNTILNTEVSDNKGGGIEFGLINHNIKIKNVSVLNNLDNGIDLNGNNYINITDSRINSNDGHGIDFGGPSEHQWIENCTINENKKSGVYLHRAAYVDIKDCIIEKNEGSAGIFSDKKVEKINITNSEISKNIEDGIELYEAKYVNITDSNINDNSYNGISFNGSEIQENNIIQNCIIAWNGHNGIYFYTSSINSPPFNLVINSIIQKNQIFSNWIYSNTQNGIYFYSYSQYYCYSYIQRNDIFNNLIKSNNNNGIYFYTYTDDNTYDSYIQNNNIYNNTIHSNNQNGIYFNGRSDDSYFRIEYNKIFDNILYSNLENGIYFTYSYRRSGIRYNDVYNNTIYLNSKNGIVYGAGSSSSYLHIEYNNFYNNTIYSNSQNGLFFNYYCEDIYFKNNNFYLNKVYSNGQNGIYFYIYCYYYYSNIYFQYNKIYSNEIYSNNENGIYFYLYSDANYIHTYSYFQYNNLYLNSVYLNNQNGIFYDGSAKNGYLFIQYNEVYSNTIYSQNHGSGIFLQSGINKGTWHNSNIYNNTLDSNLIGIEFIRIQSHIVNINNITDNSNDGIRLISSTSNTFGYNLIGDNNWSGLNLKSSSSNNRIQNNNITSNNQYGVFVKSKSNSNTIIRNDIINHPNTGVNITGSTDNFLHHNNFKNNTRNAYDSTTQLNDWDDGTEGNWWDDYTGFDSNTDGIGDIPYDVPGGGSKDWYPIIKPANITAPRIENTTPEDGEKDVEVNSKISITFTNKMNKTATESAISVSGGLTPKNFGWSNGDMTVTFALSASLISETLYTVTILLTAKDVLENFLENTYKFSFTSEDIIPPKIISTIPSYYSIDVELNASIVVTFSEPMNSTTLTYYCSPDPGGWSVAWSVKNSVATFSHNDFGSLITYYFRITGCRDRGDNNLASGTVPNPWYFTTRDVVGPEITTTSPANGSVNILLTANVVVTFNEQMNTSSVKYSCKPDPGGWKESWSNGDRTVTFSHNTFVSQTTYTFHISAGKDLAGNPLNPSLPNPWSFSTRDTIPPKIIATSPMNGSFSIPLNAKIIVTFNEAMDNMTVTYFCNPNPSGWSVKWSGGNTVATYSHNPFTENTNYTFQITGGRDLAGNFLVSGTVPNPWVFSTLDFSAPEIIATTPTNGTIDIELNAKIVVTYSEPMNTGTFAYTCSPDPGGWTVKWSNSNTVATLSHNLFNSTTKYTFQVTSCKDMSANPLVKGSTPNPWVFNSKSMGLYH
jgi:parallel beta-helix repeat protein